MTHPISTYSGVPAPLTAETGESFRLGRGPALLVLLYGISLLLVNLGGNRVLTYHEALFCQPAKEMLATGNWVVPTIAGVPFLEKPPLTAWLLAASMALTGSESEWVVRLPGILSANLTALMIAALAARWFGSQIGLIAGLVQLTTYYMLQLSRLAECDIQLITAVCGSMCAFAVANLDSPRGRATARWLPWVFYLGAGLAFLIKGPLGPVFIFSGCGLYVLLSRDLRGLRFLANPLGLAVFALCIVPYLVIACRVYPPFYEVAIAQNLGRFQGDLGGGKPPLFYAYHVPLVLLPWFPLAAVYVARGAKQGLLAQPLWRFTACWLIPGMTLLCLSTFKVKNYPAPLLPAFSILAALGLIDLLQRGHACGNRYRYGWGLVALVGCAIGMGVVARLDPRGASAMLAMIALLFAGILLVLWLEHKGWLNAQLAAVFSLAWLFVSCVHVFIMPHHDSYRDQAVLARRVNAALPPDGTLFTVNLPDDQIYYYLDPRVNRIDATPHFLDHLAQQPVDSCYVLAPEHVTDALSAQGRVEVLDRCDSVIRRQQPNQRLTLVRLDRDSPRNASLPASATR